MWPATAKRLFNHKALAKVFRAKFLAALHEQGLVAPPVPMKWVVHCKCVGDGRKALACLGRYLYRGVIQEHDIIGCDGVNVTYRWRDGKKRKHHGDPQAPHPCGILRACRRRRGGEDLST